MVVVVGMKGEGGGGLHSFQKQTKTNKGMRCQTYLHFFKLVNIFIVIVYICLCKSIVIFGRGWGNTLERTCVEEDRGHI